MAVAKKADLGLIVVVNTYDLFRYLHEFVNRNVQSGQLPPNSNNKLLSAASKAVHSIRSDIQTITGGDFQATKRLFQTELNKQ